MVDIELLTNFKGSYLQRPLRVKVMQMIWPKEITLIR